MIADRTLGRFLRERRTRLDSAALGYASGRRRTPGLRREEVASRAGISATWYSWLEQGRGGAPSADALDRIAKALLLSEVEREHLFLLGLGRPPAVRYRSSGAVPPRLQHVLDALGSSPALIRTAAWDVVAWNMAATAVLGDYGALAPAERNLLRLLFLDPQARRTEVEWESVARFVVGAFRADAVRAGADATVRPLVDELRAASADFAAMWRESAVNGSCEHLKRLRHPRLGRIALAFSSFAVGGRSDLTMLVYTPATAADAVRIERLIASRPGQAEAEPRRTMRGDAASR